MAPAALEATLESWLEGETEEQRQQAALQQDIGGSTSSSGDILPAVRGGLCGCLSESRPATEQADWHEHARCLHAYLQEWQLMRRIVALSDQTFGARLAASVDAHLAACGQLDATVMLHGCTFAIVAAAAGRQPTQFQGDAALAAHAAHAGHALIFTAFHMILLPLCARRCG